MLRLQRTLFSAQLRGICFHHPQRNLSPATLTSSAALARHLSGPASQSAIYRPYKQGDWNNPIGNEVNRTAIKARTNDQIWLEKSEEARKQLALHPPPDPYAGRSVKVYAGNVADAYNRLDKILKRNRVKRTLKLTERHEKKGVKRRRLKSERWRRRFANEVRNKVQLVAKIRRRGA